MKHKLIQFISLVLIFVFGVCHLSSDGVCHLTSLSPSQDEFVVNSSESVVWNETPKSDLLTMNCRLLTNMNYKLSTALLRPQAAWEASRDLSMFSISGVRVGERQKIAEGVLASYWQPIEVIRTDGISVEARTATFVKGEAEFHLWHDEESRNYNWRKYTYYNPPREEEEKKGKEYKPRPGMTIEEFVKEYGSDDLIFTSNGTQVVWNFRNGFLISEGRLMAKPADVPCLFEDEGIIPLNGEFTVFNLDNGCLETIEIANNELKTKIRGSALPGAPIVQNGRFVPPQYSGKRTPPQNNQVAFDYKIVPAAWVVVGTRGDGSTTFVHSFGDLMLKDFVEEVVIRELNLRYAVLLGGSADSQCYIFGQKSKAARKRPHPDDWRDPEYPRKLGQIVAVYKASEIKRFPVPPATLDEFEEEETDESLRGI